MKPIIKLKRLPNGEGLSLPLYATDGAAGCDLEASGNYVIPSHSGRVMVRTGFAIEIPAGYEAQIRPRSSLALNCGVTVANAPGTIDSDYRGEVCVIMVNHFYKPFRIKHGDRIAQLVIAPVVQGDFRLVDELSETKRGDGGFGSTGR